MIVLHFQVDPEQSVKIDRSESLVFKQISNYSNDSNIETKPGRKIYEDPSHAEWHLLVFS